MATATYIKGDMLTVNYTATGACAVDLIRVLGVDNGGASVGVHRTALTTGDVGVIDIKGAYTFPKATGAAIAVGESVDWDASIAKVEDNQLSAATGDVSDFAVALETKAAAATSTTIDVQLLPGNGTLATS